MAIAPAEQGRANVVRAIDQKNLFPFAKPLGNPVVVSTKAGL
jgi:hypothetical protein